MNTPLVRFAALGVSVALLSACGSTRTFRVLTGQPAAPHDRGVTIQMAGGPDPAVNMREIAIVQAFGSGTNADLEHVIDGLTREAQRLGCDAVIRVRVDQGSSGASANGVCVAFVESANLPNAATVPPVAQPSMPAPTDPSTPLRATPGTI
jgi:hypothetical protein